MTQQQQQEIDKMVKKAEIRLEKLDWLYTKCSLKYVHPWIIWNEFSNSGVKYNRNSWNNP